jgi:hypothetical protein
MAFVFDPSISGVASNSFISLSDANDYFSSRYGVDAWTELNDTDKQKLLVQSTYRLNRERFIGLPTTRSQSLAWPRQYMIDVDGLPLSSTSIPKELKWATCELALYTLTESDRLMNDNELENFKSYEIGLIKLQTNVIERDRLPSNVEGLLKRIGIGAYIPANGNNISEMSR